MSRKPVPPPPLAPLRGAASPVQARPVRGYPPPPVPQFHGRAPAAQAKRGAAPPPPNPWRHGAGARPVIQRSADVKENKATESSQATYLTATNMTNEQLLAENVVSSGGAHSEDLLIDKVLPWAAENGKLVTGSDNVIFVGINRSPCTSTDHCGNGSPSCDKGAGKTGCAERLIALVTGGFTHKGTAYSIKLIIQVRNIYGSDSDQQANSARAIEAMAATGRIACDQQRTATSEKFLGLAAAKKL